MIKKQVRI